MEGQNTQTQPHCNPVRELDTDRLASRNSNIYSFFLTWDYHVLVFLSPSALMPFIIYLVPLDDKRYHLKLRKIEVNAEIKTQ